MSNEASGNGGGSEGLLGGTLGSLFQAAREARGIPIEQAAHETRIRLPRLREIEANDLSYLSPAYARMFIRDYARYLGLSDRQIEEALPESGEFGVEGYQYIQNAPGHGPRIRKMPSPKKRLRNVAGALALLTVLLFIGWQVWTTWRKLEAISSSELKAKDQLVMEAEEIVQEPSPKALTTVQVVEQFRAVGEDRPNQATTPEENEEFSIPANNPPPVLFDRKPRSVDALFLDGQIAISPNSAQ